MNNNENSNLASENNHIDNIKIANALLFIRLAIFLVILMWTLDKFINPAHTAAVFTNFYGLSGWGPTAFMILGGLELVLLVGFVVGFKKRFTYGLVFLIHAVSTLSTWKQYLDPINNLLFFAAIPMLAACWALYSLRELDTRLTVD